MIEPTRDSSFPLAQQIVEETSLAHVSPMMVMQFAAGTNLKLSNKSIETFRSDGLINLRKSRPVAKC